MLYLGFGLGCLCYVGVGERFGVDGSWDSWFDVAVCDGRGERGVVEYVLKPIPACIGLSCHSGGCRAIGCVGYEDWLIVVWVNIRVCGNEVACPI